MALLVTGGAGFIGSNLVKTLCKNGEEVVVIDDLSSGHIDNIIDMPIEFIEGSICDTVTLEKAGNMYRTVFHLAASVGNSRSINNPIGDAQTNVLGTINILDNAIIKGIGKIIISSSAGIFGELMDIPIGENHPTEPDSPYGCTKLCEEKLGLAYGKLYSKEVICLRYFNVYGENQMYDAYGNVIPIFVFNMLRGEPITIFGDGEQTRDFVNVQDVVQANLKAASTSGVSGAFNIGSGESISINRLVEILAEASGLVPKVYYGPERKGDVRDSLADIKKAREILDYKPKVNMEEGIKEYIDWAKWVINKK